ncbi:MAG: DUF2848 domain-containing protein [Alphaproteobacteria bacterium]|nr:DUF2848 domain-containing protein [Alphaproteobacteria bacterium]
MDACASLELTGHAKNGDAGLYARIDTLVIAGWTGRDEGAMQAHIAELEALGISRPKSTPIFYRVAAALLTTAEAIEVSGEESSGEVETVVLSLPDGLWVGVGSDHTDRKIEAVNVTASKQMCAKPIGRELWPYAEVEDHWDQLVLRSFATVGGKRRLYQEGTAATMRPPGELMRLYTASDAGLPPGSAMFGGTLAVAGGIAPAESFEIELHDPVLKRTIGHRYAVRTLPIEG